jgi:hypothetical protein
MPFPEIDPAFETFLEPTRIFLFGKKFPSLKYDPTSMSGGIDAAARAAAEKKEYEDFTIPAAAKAALAADKPKEAELPMPPSPVEWALRQVEDDGIFARIYGFSFEGHYYKLPRPVLFLVRENRARNPEEVVVDGWRQFNTRFTGIEGKDWQFSGDIMVWAVDRYDMAISLDVEIGSYDQVLLQSFAASQEEGAARSAGWNAWPSRNAASFRGKGWGAHQDR